MIGCAATEVALDAASADRSDAATDASKDRPAPDAETPLDAADPGDAGLAPDAAGITDAGTDAAVTADAGLTAVDAAASSVDLDQDGLTDAEELRIMGEYLPFLSIDPADRCPLAFALFRLRPHPGAAGRLHAIVVLLFERDCGASSHPGDDEVFGLTIDPARPAPEGLLALKAISHQSTPCEHVSECGACTGLTACTPATRRGRLYPAVFYSRGKHGAYLSEAACDNACFLTNQCLLAPTPTEPPLLNAGEPAAPLVRDLTTAGLITAAAGWTEPTLMHYDPWGPDDFGGAGSVRSDLEDPAFLTPACTP